MYSLLLILHSWLRWGAIIAGLLAVATLVSSRGRHDHGSADRWGLFFLIALDLQMLIGLLLYFVVSPNMAAIRDNFAEAMRSSHLRFWAVEHITLMFVAVVALHVGRALARGAASPDGRRRRLLIASAIALVAIVAATPWPGRPAGRPLLRLSGQS